ncbi:MAG TPA: Ig-like domain-containing protein [Gammaproteobacteria bacterium]|nr:Ig-like domain-containing protein [Gammaproteobacteria bacterium]
MNNRFGLVLVLLAFALGGCVKEEQSQPPAPAPQSTFSAYFAPQGGEMPYPNDLYFNGSEDGTLNIPLTDQAKANPAEAPVLAVNQIDGFSTQAPISANFTAPIDPDSVVGGKTVFVFQVQEDPKTHAVVKFIKPLAAGVDYKAGVSPVNRSVLTITPLHPLDTSSAYEVVLTDGIKSTDGSNATADTQYAQIKQALASNADLPDPTLNQIKLLEGAMLQVATGAGLDPSHVILTWSFATESAGATLAYIDAHAKPLGGVLQPMGITTQQINKQFSGHADIYVGDVKIPYYLPVPTTQDPTAPLTGHWTGQNGTALTQYNPAPVQTATLSIPLLATVPNAQSTYEQMGGTEPAGGWPVVIFQHGITGNRTNMLAIADSFADAGFAVVAIDLPLHGVTDTTNPFYQADHERTFNLDVQDNQSGAAGADSKIDSSGAHFINLTSLLTSRDNVREGAADLISLTKTLPTIDYNGDGQPDFNGSRIYFVGHSLGAIVGVDYLAVDKTAISATLASPGGHLALLLQKSPQLSGPINSGLASQGLQPGSPLYFDFFRNAQTVIGAADPANYAAAAAANHPIHMTEVVGSPGSAPDQVIPPMFTDLLANEMGLMPIHTTTTNPDGVRGIVRFLVGSHGSLLDPTASLPATVEMQTETVTFAASNGMQIVITDPTVVK